MIYIVDYRRKFTHFCDGYRITHLDSAREIPADTGGILCHWNNDAILRGGIPTRCKMRDLLLDGLYDHALKFPIVFFAGDMSTYRQRICIDGQNITKLTRELLALLLPRFVQNLDFTTLTQEEPI